MVIRLDNIPDITQQPSSTAAYPYQSDNPPDSKDEEIDEYFTCDRWED